MKGEDITVTPTDEPEHVIIDMMEALKASIAAGADSKPAKRSTTTTRKKRAAQAK